MRKRILKKSEVLREGYMRGLRSAQRIIDGLVNEGAWTEEDEKRYLDLKAFDSAWHCNYTELREVLQKGADVNVKKGRDGDTALHGAAYLGDARSCRLLLKFGADVGITNKYGVTALQAAAGVGSAEVCRMLLDAGADVGAQDNSGATPLYCAAREGYVDVVELLLEAGADIDVKCHWKWTPLHVAALNGHLEVIKLLLENGADATALNDEGETAYDVALKGDEKECCEILERYM